MHASLDPSSVVITDNPVYHSVISGNTKTTIISEPLYANSESAVTQGNQDTSDQSQ